MNAPAWMKPVPGSKGLAFELEFKTLRQRLAFAWDMVREASTDSWGDRAWLFLGLVGFVFGHRPTSRSP